MKVDLKSREHQIRKEIVEMYLSAEGGHLPAALSLVEPLVALFFSVMDREDRFILSKGHGCLALYAVLIHQGRLPADFGKKIGQVGSPLGWHPCAKDVFGMDVSSGSLGLGASVAVGRALHGQLKDLPYHTYCVLGDGECNEGSVWEAAMAASQRKLSRLHFLIDANGYQANGKTADVCNLEPLSEKWRSFGFQVAEFEMKKESGGLLAALQQTKRSPAGPYVWICRTEKGAGIPFIEGNPSWHSKNKLSDQEKLQLQEWLRA